MLVQIVAQGEQAVLQRGRKKRMDFFGEVYQEAADFLE